MPNLRRIVSLIIIVSSLLLSATWLGSGCASDLNGARKVHQNTGVPLDVSQLKYFDIDTGAEVAVDKYMEVNGLKHMLLMFGAHGCEQCTKKSKDLSANYLGSHSLFLGSYQSTFALMGLTTNADGSLSKFNAMRRNPANNGAFDYVHWNDPKGNSVMKFFLPEGEMFQVPFTVLISRDAILYRTYAREGKSVGLILNEVQSIVDGTIVVTPSAEPTVKPTPSASPSPSPTGELPGFEAWKFETPDRFRSLTVSGCGLGESTSLDSQLEPADVRLIHLIPEKCNANCRSNLQELRSLEAFCKESSSGGNGVRCSVISLATTTEAEGLCGAGAVRAGGRELVAGFASHFDWDTVPEMDPATGVPASIPAMTDPMLLGFFPNGRLVLSREGAFSAQSIIQKMNSPNLIDRPKGPDFKLLGDDHAGAFVGELNFSKTLQDAEYTIVAGFDVACQSCVEELIHWSEVSTEKPHLFDYCRNSGGFCQVLALETYPPYQQTAQRMYEQIKPNMTGMGIRIPLLIDRETVANEFSRFFEGHLSPKFPDWDGLPGTAIYDREGKIVAAFKSQSPGEEDIVFETIKTIKKIVRPNSN